MLKDLDRIQELAKENEEENTGFRTFLKTLDQKAVDKIVHSLNQKYSSWIDCTTCANCCKIIQPLVSKKDIRRLARYFDITEEEFKKKYSDLDNFHNLILNETPCRFLDSGKCMVYAHRPYDCRSYPHLHKNGFTDRLLGVIINYSICPIVFNVYEELKVRMGIKASMAH